jgi:4,5-DOPA dioxygenase extradiol
MLPSLFLSHGAPTLPLTDTPARHFLAGLGGEIERRFGKPKSILIASAHWETTTPTVSAPPLNETIYDFRGFPPELYRLRYPAPGSTDLAERASDLLCAAGLDSEVDSRRGLDHGAWVPLRLMYPEADIPVAQVSVQSHLGPAHHRQLGRALAPLREEGVLIIGSGSFTHDLSEFRAYRDALNEPEPDWVRSFADWFVTALAERRVGDLLAYRRLAPNAVKNHPTEEHLLPLFVALGAGEGHTPEHLHASTTHGVLRMDVFAFH